MKKPFFQLFTFAIALSIGFTMSSCSDDDPIEGGVSNDSGSITDGTDGGSTNPPSDFIATTSVPEGYNLGIVSPNSNTYLISSENDDISRISFVVNGANSRSIAATANANGTAIFNAMEIQSLTIKDVTYSFRRNDNNVNVIVTWNGANELVENAADISSLNGGGFTGNNLSSRIAYAFSNINKAIEVVAATNNKMDNASVIYSYTQETNRYLGGLRNDSERLGNDSLANALANRPNEGQIIHIDRSDINYMDSLANSNTGSGFGYEIPIIPSDTTEVPAPIDPVPSDSSAIMAARLAHAARIAK